MITFYRTTDLPSRIDSMAWYPYSPGRFSSYKYAKKYPKFADPKNPQEHEYWGNAAIRTTDGNWMAVPRGLCPRTAPEVWTVRKNLPAINCKHGPRDDQQAEVLNKSVQLLKEGHNHIVECPTGWGKTWLGCSVAAAVGEPTLIIATKNDILEQWRTTLIKLIGVPSNEIGHVQGDVCDYKGKRFVLAMVHSVSKPGRYPPELYRYFGLILFDECHKLAAEHFISGCQLYPAQMRLGLTATTKRSDGLWPLIEAHIGPVMVKGTAVPMAPKVLAQNSGWRMPRKTEYRDGMYVEVPIPHGPGKMGLVYRAMASSMERNQIIANFCGQCVASGRTVVVMSDSLEHLKLLFQAVSNTVSATEIGFYVGGMSKVELGIGAFKKVVLCTYAMTQEGTDFPHWSVLVMATPRANVEQAVGRVIRKMEGKPRPIVLDLVDGDPIFRTFYLARQKTYFKLGAEIVNV